MSKVMQTHQNQTQIHVTANFKCGANGHCKKSQTVPDQKSIILAINMAKKDFKDGNLIVIGRFAWLERHKLQIPGDMEFANICVMIKGGKIERAFYSNVLTHVIKKQNYNIQILN